MKSPKKKFRETFGRSSLYFEYFEIQKIQNIQNIFVLANFFEYFEYWYYISHVRLDTMLMNGVLKFQIMGRMTWQYCLKSVRPRAARAD